MEVVRHLNQIDALALYGQRCLGYHPLQTANAALVAAPISLVRDEQHAVL